MEHFSTIDQLSIAGQKYTWNLQSVSESLQLIVSSSIFSPKLRNSHGRAKEIIKLIDQAINEAISAAEQDRGDDEFNPFLFKPIMDADMNKIRSEWQKLKPILAAEIGGLPTYYIDSIAAYDTDTLIENGSKLFPEALLSSFPDLESDAEMAGKALIFQMPTACGFHVFRIIEAVARIYFERFEPELEKHPTLGWISRDLNTKKLGDQTLAFALQNLVDQFRNPIFHPDISLKQDEAVLLVGLANSVLVPMLSTIEANS